jgi:AraC-like DNA-binding protein
MPAGRYNGHEEILAERLDQPLTMRALCELLGVGERMLRSCCAEFLGMTPLRYVQCAVCAKFTARCGTPVPIR